MYDLSDNGGGDALAQSLAAQVHLAAAQTQRVDADGREQQYPSFDPSRHPWPPLFLAGDLVEFEPRRLEEVRVGDYVVVRHPTGVRVGRFLDWRYDGAGVSMLVLLDVQSRKPERLPGALFLGAVVWVTRGDSRTDPNRVGFLRRLYLGVTACGTSSPLGRTRLYVQEALLVMSARRNEQKRSPGLLSALRDISEEHRKERELAAREKARREARKAADAEALALAGSRDDLARQLGLRPSGR